ncbi:MAG: SDR family NAD(P)-dependent oxidoreductase, partial [Acidobacteriaceae bacterium]
MGILNSFRLDGKTALVTGAASGIGAAIAVALAEAGAAVACHGNRRPGDETAQRIREAGGRAQSFSADLSHPDGPDR